MQVCKLYEQQGIKPAAKQTSTEASIAVIDDALTSNILKGKYFFDGGEFNPTAGQFNSVLVMRILVS